MTIGGLSAHDVRVRILGDVAIIHARTSYTTADGEQRNGRYTDVWARRDGKWHAKIKLISVPKIAIYFSSILKMPSKIRNQGHTSFELKRG